MVRPESMEEFIDDVIETFGFLLAQEINNSPLTPKDTSTMAKSFPGTFRMVKTATGNKLTFNTPYYTKFVHDGTIKMTARPFINQIFNAEGERLLKQAFRMVDKRYVNK